MMVRAALTSKRGRDGLPVAGARFLPAASVVAASALAALPIVSMTGWWPNFGFLMLIGWRLLRADPWPAWWAAPLGLFNDLVTGAPIGLSVAWWTLAMLTMEWIDRRTEWRDYWLEWAIAVVLVTADRLADWQVAALAGAPVPLRQIVPAIAINILAFPLAAMLVTRLDRWRLGR